jgi:hypothetical protein
MNLDDAKSVGELVVFIGLGGYTAWKARKAEKQTVATGNGFARFVKESLVRLEMGQKRNDEANVRIEKKIDDHVASHADADVHGRRWRTLRDVNEL